MKVHIYHKDITKEIQEMKTKGRTRKEISTYASKVGRFLLRKGLKDLYGLDSNQLKIKKGVQGKPSFPKDLGIYFNISHSKGCIVCAISKSNIGIDVEEIDEKNTDKLAKKLMSKEEFEEYIIARDKSLYFYSHWVRMESYLKYTGQGISRALGELEYDGYGQVFSIQGNFIGAIWTGEKVSSIKFVEVIGVMDE